MTVKIIAENLIDDDNFLSATEQAGPYWEQPEADSSNDDNEQLDPVISGTPADFDYSGTTSGAGAGDGSTVVCSDLDVYGDDYFIGGTIEITSGAASGETQTISDFAQATGTFTMSSNFSAQIVGAVTFDLNVDFSTRDFKIELTASGDTGTSTFKWSHDNGTTYLGRSDPGTAADWIGESGNINQIVTGSYVKIAKLGNGNIAAFFNDSADLFTIKFKESSDNGISWGAAVTAYSQGAGNFYIRDVKVTNAGRIYLWAYSSVSSTEQVLYSDDNGSTWTTPVNVTADGVVTTSTWQATDYVLLSNGNIGVATKDTAAANRIYYYVSTDGISFSSATQVHSPTANTVSDAYIIELQNGNLLCAFTTDEDALNNFEIKGRISEDGGASWNSSFEISSYVATDLKAPALCQENSGRIICAYWFQSADQEIQLTYSDDGGATWETPIIVLNAGAGDDYSYPDLNLIDGQLFTVASFLTGGNYYIRTIRSGVWEAFAANGCPTAKNLLAQPLICTANLKWQGANGVSGDIWTFEAGYEYSMKNLIKDSPSKPYRSLTDNAEMSIVLDAGANQKLYADGVGLHGCNIRDLTFEMNDTDVWTAPSVSEDISFDITDTGSIELADNGNTIIHGGLARANTPNGVELISNGDFSSDTTGWTAPSQGTIASTTGGYRNNCCTLTRVSNESQFFYQDVKTEVNKAYVVSFYLKSGSSGDEAATVYVYDNYNNIYQVQSDYTSSATWTKYTLSFRAISNTYRLFFYKQTATAGTMLWDEISCQKYTHYGKTHQAKNDYIKFTSGSENGNVYALNSNYELSPIATVKADTKWCQRLNAADNNWFSVCYGNGLFVAIAYSGVGNRVMTSPDGINWTIRVSAADNSWHSVCYGNGLFVAVAVTGAGNRVMTSPDGINWTIRVSAANNSWNSVCYGNGLFVAIAYSGVGNRVMTSPDGINWTIRVSAADNGWHSVCYGNGLFVAVAYSGAGNRVMTSPDGINWTIRVSAADNSWHSVCYGNGLFVAVAVSGAGNRVMTSPDGINWTIRVSAADNGWHSVCYGNGLFVAVAVSGVGNRVMTSPDGINWTIRVSAADNDWYSVCYGNGLFVAIAATGVGNRVMTSGNHQRNTNIVEINTTSALSLSAKDRFVLFVKKISNYFSGGAYRYIRLLVPAQHTADDYYQLGTLTAGRCVSLTKDWSPAYQKNTRYNVELLRIANAGIVPIKQAGDQRIFQINWNVLAESEKEEVLSILSNNADRAFTLIPSDDDYTDCYLALNTGMANSRYVSSSYWNLGAITLEEVI